jgi:hypothetical protein
VLMRYFDLVQPSSGSMMAMAQSSQISITNMRLFYGNVNDSIALPVNGTLSLNACVAVSSGSRYLVGSSGRNSSFNINQSLIYGSAQNIFSRLDQGDFSFTLSTFWNIQSPITWTLPSHCPTRG